MRLLSRRKCNSFSGRSRHRPSGPELQNASRSCATAGLISALIAYRGKGCESIPSLAKADHYPQVVRWTRASGTTGGKGEAPSLAKEGTAAPSSKWSRSFGGAAGWFVQLPMIGGLNQPPRLRPLGRLRGIFLMGAATPPCPRLSKEGTSLQNP